MIIDHKRDGTGWKWKCPPYVPTTKSVLERKGRSARTDGRTDKREVESLDAFISEMSVALLGARASKGTSYWLLGRDDGSVEKVWKQSH